MYIQYRINNRSKIQYEIPIFISNGLDKIHGMCRAILPEVAAYNQARIDNREMNLYFNLFLIILRQMSN